MPRTLRLLGLLVLLALPARTLAAPPVVDWAGSSWSGEATLSAKISRVGKIEGPAVMDLDFGLQAEPALAADEFRIVLDDGSTPLFLSGTWLLDAKGRPVLALDISDLATQFQQLLLDVCLAEVGDPELCDLIAGLDVVVDPEDFKLKLKAKDEEGVTVVSARGKLKFALFFEGQRVLRVTLSFKSNALLGD